MPSNHRAHTIETTLNKIMMSQNSKKEEEGGERTRAKCGGNQNHGTVPNGGKALRRKWKCIPFRAKIPDSTWKLVSASLEITIIAKASVVLFSSSRVRSFSTFTFISFLNNIINPIENRKRQRRTDRKTGKEKETHRTPRRRKMGNEPAKIE